MPKVAFAILCRAAIAHNDLISILDGPIDTIATSKVPFVTPVTLVIRFLWTHGELDRMHRGEIFFSDEDGKRLIKMDIETQVNRPEKVPISWEVGSNLIIGFPLNIVKFGEYRFDILIDDKSISSLPFRAVQATNNEE